MTGLDIIRDAAYLRRRGEGGRTANNSWGADGPYAVNKTLFHGQDVIANGVVANDFTIVVAPF
jgi:hypothetical protein